MAYFQLQPSVWDLVKEHVPESELLEIRAVLGESLIDMYTEIYTEVETLEQIWLKVQRSSRQEPPPPAPRAPLSDPPAVKELLKAELQLLLQALRERAAAQGRDGDATLSRYSPRVVSYALGGGGADGQTAPPRRPCVPGGAQSRPASSLSQSGGRPCSRASSSSSSCEDEVEAMRHQLNISYIDEVVSRLKSVLTEECEALKQDVRFLQEQVETAFERQRNWEVPEPTVIELKEERKRIQRDLNLPRMLSCPVPGEGPRGRVSQHDPRQIRSAVQRPIHSVSGSPQRERAMPPSGTRPPRPARPHVPLPPPMSAARSRTGRGPEAFPLQQSQKPRQSLFPIAYRGSHRGPPPLGSRGPCH